MLNIFPELLFIGGALAPFVLRLMLALALFSLALFHLKHKNEALIVSIIPQLKRHASLILHTSIYGTFIIAILLAAGLLTQLAAMISAIVCIKVLYIKRRYPEIAPESRNFYLLLFGISVIVLFAGAGPFSFDIPL